ncbi:Serine/threonine protein phosphatase 1 [Cronobacter sakazakii 680]|nr:Serine/threonine protein phosphatase 1 [Cronobacter sakazakii 680]
MWSRARVNRVSAGKEERIERADACYFGHTPLREPLTCGKPALHRYRRGLW